MPQPSSPERATGSPPRVAFSCVVDTQARFHRQALLWYHGLKKFVNVQPGEVFIHHTKGCDPALMAYFAAEGVRTIEVETFDTRSLPLNKLRQLDTPELADFDYVVLSDCDKVYFPELRSVIRGDAIKACFFVARPPLPVFEALYAQRGLPLGRVIARPAGSKDDPDPKSLWNNANGGTYIIPKRHWPLLVKRWAQMSRWLLDQPSTLGQWMRNVDQVGLCMVLDEAGMEIDLLPKLFDVGVNVKQFGAPEASNKAARTPFVGAIHYHDQVSAQGRVVPGEHCHPLVREKIDHINQLADTLPGQAATLYASYCEVPPQPAAPPVQAEQAAPAPQAPKAAAPAHRNTLEVDVFCLQHSGQHAFVASLLQQFEQPQVFLNNVAPHFADPYTHFHFTEVANAVPVNRLRKSGAQAIEELRQQKKPLLLIGYENLNLLKLASADCIPERLNSVGLSKKLVPLLLLGDYFGWMARWLQQRSASNAAPVDLGSAILKQTKLWQQYAQEFAGQTQLLGPDAVKVSLNAWATQAPYRRALLRQLGIPRLNVALPAAPQEASTGIDAPARQHIDEALSQCPDVLTLNTQLFALAKPW